MKRLFFWPMELLHLADLFGRFGNIAVINNKVLLNYGFFYSHANFNNLDETSSSIHNFAFNDLRE